MLSRPEPRLISNVLLALLISLIYARHAEISDIGDL